MSHLPLQQGKQTKHEDNKLEKDKKMSHNRKKIMRGLDQNTFLFNCKRCKKKTSFILVNVKRLRGAVLRCCECNLLISRNINKIKTQMIVKEQKDSFHIETPRLSGSLSFLKNSFVYLDTEKHLFRC